MHKAFITGIKGPYGDNIISVMPNNLYGPNDNYNLKNSHVLPALIRKFHEAKIYNSSHVEVWGTDNPLREFLHVDDLAVACLYLMNNIDADELYNSGISHINIGSGEEVSIKELAIMIKKVIDYNGDLVFNSDYPDGTPRKLLDVSRLNTMGWKSKIKLEDGLKSVYEWYLDKLLKD
jgi:GDP-L-fucose synthase